MTAPRTARPGRGRPLPARVELRRVELVLVDPLVSAHGVEDRRHSILVSATDDEGRTGWGECPALLRPTYTGEWHLGAWSVLIDEVAPAALAGRPSGITGHPMAESAIDTALLDLALRAEGRSLRAALGGTRTAIPTTAVVGMVESVDALLARVAAHVEGGHRSVKLKIAPGRDLEPVLAVRAAWPDLALAVDANGAYTLDDLDRLSALAGADLLYVEQPLAADDLVGHARLVRSLGVPVALDESASSPGAVAAAVALGAASVVNLKPARLGGIGPTLAVHDLLVEASIPAFVGGMLELGIGRAAALAVASLPGCSRPTDLGPSARYVVDDVTEPFELGPGAVLTVPDAPGIGVEPRAERLAEVTVAHRVLDRR